ncbi:MAG: hypothetical protein ACMUJM_08140 [bacterium]
MFHKEVKLNQIEVADFIEFDKKKVLWLRNFTRILHQNLEKIFSTHEVTTEKNPTPVNVVCNKL